MGNHNIDCEYCGQDTRGLGGVRGCDTAVEAAKCYSFREGASDKERCEMSAAAASEIERSQQKQTAATPAPTPPSADRDALASIIASALIGAGHGSAIGIGVYQRIADAVIRYYDERGGK